MAKLKPVVIDLETYWSATHSLSKMNPILYCLHPETEIISCAAKVGGEDTYVTFGEDKIRKQTMQFDWSDKIVVGHNLSLFDAMILKWRLGVKPARWACTLAMARPLHGLTTGLSLESLCAHYAKELTQMGINPVKDKSALIATKGRHLADFTAEEIKAMRAYNKNDVEQCAGLFRILYPLTPAKEMKIIDGTVRMLVTPKFRLDTGLLKSALDSERKRKRDVLLELAGKLQVIGTDEDDLVEQIRASVNSSKIFAGILKDLGVEPPMKPSPTNPEKQTYALAKTDEAFIALQDNDNPLVAAAASARLGVKSTILETRLDAFLKVAEATGGRMPIAKNYYGAHTGRFSGALKLNQENLPRISGKPSDALRNSLIAPKGYKVVVADLSGIELRVNMYLWKVPYAMALFDADPEKADLYKALASEVMGVPIEGMPKMVRQAGKAMHLGCGFSLASAVKYIAVAKQMAGIVVTEEEAEMHIAGYRSKHPEIVRGWRTCDDAISMIYAGATTEVDPWGIVTTDKEGFVLPSGRKVRYPLLRGEMENGRRKWVYGEGRSKSSIYGGRADENIVQALARDILMDNAISIEKETGMWPCHTVHDELIYIAPESEAQSVLDTVQRHMRTPPSWFPALKTWSEGDIADSYGEAK